MKDDIRKPPVEARLKLHPHGKRGTCGWCGEPVTETIPRGWLKYFHEKCSIEMAVIAQPDQARRVVLERDHGICADCGRDASGDVRFVPAYYVSVSQRAIASRSSVTPGPKRGSLVWLSGGVVRYPGGTALENPYVALTVISTWHVDHRVPLWKVSHLPPVERLQYFMLDNLQTLCDACHTLKTRKEAAERAHLDKLAGRAPASNAALQEPESEGVPDPQEPREEVGATRLPRGCGRKLQSRGFDKRYVKKFNGKIRRR